MSWVCIAPKKSDKCIFFSKRTKNFTDFTKNNNKQAFAGRKKFRHLLFFEKRCWNSVIKFLILFFGKKNLQKLQLLESKKSIQTGNALFWSSVIFFVETDGKILRFLQKNYQKIDSKLSPNFLTKKPNILKTKHPERPRNSFFCFRAGILRIVC